MSLEDAQTVADALEDIPDVEFTNLFGVSADGARDYGYPSDLEDNPKYERFGVQFRTEGNGLTPAVIEVLNETDFERVENSLTHLGDFRVYV